MKARRTEQLKKVSPGVLGGVALTIFLSLVANSMSSKIEGSAGESFIISVAKGLFDPELLASLRTTLLYFGTGFLLALIVATILGFAMGRVPTIERFFAPVISALRPIPSAAIIPFAILFFSYGGAAMKIFVITYGCLWPMLIHVFHAVRDIPQVTIDTARTLGKNRREILYEVVLQAALPALFVSARIGLAIGLLLAITTEIVLLGEDGGIGYMIVDYQRSFRYPELMSATLLIGIVGWVMDRFFRIVERVALPWHQTR